MNIEQARQKAAQAWCEPSTEHIVMDCDLAEAFANILLTALASAQEEAAQNIEGMEGLKATIVDLREEAARLREANEHWHMRVTSLKAQVEVAERTNDRLREESKRLREIIRQCGFKFEKIGMAMAQQELIAILDDSPELPTPTPEATT